MTTEHAEYTEVKTNQTRGKAIVIELTKEHAEYTESNLLSKYSVCSVYSVVVLSLSLSSYNPFDLGLWVMAKVDQQTRFQASGLKVIMNLGSMFVGQLFNRFKFDDDAIVADKIRFKGLNQRLPIIYISDSAWYTIQLVAYDYNPQPF